MQVVANEKLIRRRGRIGQIVSWSGLGILLIGMIVSFQAKPTQSDYGRWITISLVCLGVGFLGANIGGYFMRRWGRRPRPDELLATAMKGFDDRYVFFTWTLPAPLVMLSPRGVYVFVTRDHAGDIYVEEERWRQPWQWRRILTAFAQEGLGNPGKDVLDDAGRLRQFIAQHLPDLAEIPIYPIVVFLHPRAELHLNNPSAPVIAAKKLKAFLRAEGRGEAIEAEDRHALAELFGLPPKRKKIKESTLTEA